jgi:G:T-mismatch repair DNA endonuclease (very short patch repair protein)
MPASLAQRWTEDEEMALITFYPASKKELSTLLARHTWRAIIQRAVILHLTRKKQPVWHPNDIALLEKFRPQMKIEELMKHFPGRSATSLFAMAEKNHFNSPYYWTERDVETIKKKYPLYPRRTIQALLPNRTWCAIKLKAEKMGIQGNYDPGKTLRVLNKNADFCSNRMKALCKKPTKPEKWMINLIDEYDLPYKYVGDGAILIEGLNPDFINVNGQKLVIEIFGRIWHETFVRDWKRTEFGRRSVFAKYGYRTLIIWDDELEDESAILNRIMQFENDAKKEEGEHA